MHQLFTAQAADGNSDSLTWKGGNGIVAVEGTWAGGTVQLQISPDGGTTWIDVSGISLTADGTASFTCPPSLLRLNLSGAGSPSLNGWLTGTDLD